MVCGVFAMNEIASYENNFALFEYAGDAAKEYGLFSKMVMKPNYSGKPDVYIVFGLEPIADDVNPVEIVNRNDRNTTLFYPESFAVNISKENPLMAWEEICTYLTRAEFMCELYDEFQVPLPQKIRVDELSALITFYCGRNNPAYDMDTRKNYAKGLREFFDDENPKSKFMKSWQEFYRSELFDGDKSFISNFIKFLKRREPETSLNVLLESNFELKKVYIPEHQYEQFRRIIKEQYPDVKYNVSDLKVVDKGSIVDPASGERVVTQFGKCVTDEEYDAIMEKRFALEGFDCIDGLSVTHYEGRYLFYKACDENIISSVYNNLRLNWVKCLTAEELLKNGKVEQVEIPFSQIKNFYYGMQQAGIPFAVDNDSDNSPKLETVRILYNASDGADVGRLMTALTVANITTSHVHSDDERVHIDFNQVDYLINNAKQIAGAKDVKGIPSFSDAEKEIE